MRNGLTTRVSRALSLARQAGLQWLGHRDEQLCAALAFYTLFSLAPLLLIAMSLAGLLWDEGAARGRIVHEAARYVGPLAATTLDGMVISASRSGKSTFAWVISLIVLFFGATAVFTELQHGLNTIWRVSESGRGGIRRIIKDRVLAFVMILGIGTLLLVSVGVSAALTALTSFGTNILPARALMLHLSDFVGTALITTFLFAMIFRFLPDVEVAWGDVWGGASITAILFAVGQKGIGIYLGHSTFASSYGLVGSVLILLLWVYYSALILLFGAELTQVYATRFGTHSALAGREDS